VDGPSLHDEPHDGTLGQELLQVLNPEADPPRPQADVRVTRLLRLQPHQVSDHVGGAGVGALEQELPLERGSVQGAKAQPVDHAVKSAQPSINVQHVDGRARSTQLTGPTRATEPAPDPIYPEVGDTGVRYGLVNAISTARSTTALELTGEL
jgi:hypothetical protein